MPPTHPLRKEGDRPAARGYVLMVIVYKVAFLPLSQKKQLPEKA